MSSPLTFSGAQYEAIGERLKVLRRRMTRDLEPDDAETVGAIVDMIAMDLATELPPGMPRDAIPRWLKYTGSKLIFPT